jgi:cell division GTPase FtsZ
VKVVTLACLVLISNNKSLESGNCPLAEEIQSKDEELSDELDEIPDLIHV